MNYAGIIYNDFAAAPGVCLTFFTQGCPHQCYNCQNPETWDFEGGLEFTQEVMDNILHKIRANNINRKLCIMGGEPLASENEFLTHLVIKTVKEVYPDTPVYIWTGYTYEELLKRNTPRINQILESANYLIDGPYIESLRDVSLEMRGSSNQRIISLHEIDK